MLRGALCGTIGGFSGEGISFSGGVGLKRYHFMLKCDDMLKSMMGVGGE